MIQLMFLMLEEATERPVFINPEYIESLLPNYLPKTGTLVQMSSGRIYAVTTDYRTLVKSLAESQL